MKIFTILFIFFFQLLSAQFTVEYRVHHRIDSAVAENDVIPYGAKLFIDGYHTLYASDARIQSDSLRLRFKASMDFGVLSAPRKRGNKTEYITGDLKNMTITQHIRIDDTGFKFTSKIGNVWNLSRETRQIGPYKANKAVGNLSGRKYTLWYTPEIPIPAGPFKLYGLPGLVLEAFDETGDIRFEMISIARYEQGLDDIVIKGENEKNISSYQEYLKVFKASMHARPSQNLYNFADAESKKRLEENYEERLRRYNNFIEK